MNKRDIVKKATTLASLTIEKTRIDEEIAKIRLDLESILVADDPIEFDYADLSWNLCLKTEDKAVLKDNKAIIKILGQPNFNEVAKVTKTDLIKAFGVGTTANCVDHYDPTTKLILSKKKKKK